MNPDSMDLVFAALAHPSRRRILDIVRQNGGCSVNDVSAYFDISRIAHPTHAVPGLVPGRKPRIY